MTATPAPDERPVRDRFWPGSLQGRILLIVLVALLVVQGIQVGFYVYDRTIGRSAIVADAIAQRVISVVELYEAATMPERRALLRAVNTRYFEVGLRVTPPPLPRQSGDRVAQEIHDRLEVLGDRPFGIWTMDTPRGRGTLISLPVAGGGWLVFSARAEPEDPNETLRVGAWIVVTMLVLALVLWAAQRTARPLARFAEAADRFGRDLTAPPLPEGGSREVRSATRAFNRMQERLRRYVDDRTMMLAAISHDLRTVLTRLKLRAEFIEDAEQRAKATADLDEMQAMLESSLSFARDEAVSEPRAMVDIAALLQSICDSRADAGGDVRYVGPDRMAFEGRPIALRRAFANLVENAIRYGGGAEVGLRGDDGSVTVTVADRGPGIPDNMQERVFAPFYRIETSRSRETGGMGLGLTTARSVIRGHGGDIRFLPRDGGGLIVRVDLPLSVQVA
ncbi:MAG: ATP-binding protein [Proteobacteria bacterium]|nr:ATP-binding protein [Pseudomonadota bacterium]MDA1133077.1 ATP-binding protein [Pseudomonadota bacterium]